MTLLLRRSCLCLEMCAIRKCHPVHVSLVVEVPFSHPAFTKLREGGIEETALHNHLMWESPRVMYMHIASHGDAVQMAKAIHAALMLSKTPGPDAVPAAQSASEPGF